MARTGSKHTDKTDEELVDMALGDNAQEAFSALYARYHDGLLANVSRRVKDKTEAEDIVIEAFTKAFRQIGTYQKGRRFSTWLLAIVKNTAIDHSDKDKTRGRKVDKQDLDPTDDEVTKLPDDAVSPEEEVILSENHEEFTASIEGLPELYREVASLSLVDNLGYKEISEKTGLPVNTVKTRLRRAKDLIAEKLRSSDDV